MPLDERIRRGLADATEDFEPAVESRLHGAVETARRRERARRRIFVMRVAATAAVILLAVVASPTIWRALQGSLPGGDPTQTPAPTLSGSYVTTLDGSQPGIAEANLEGRWTVTFGADGILDVMAPDGFTGTRSGYSFQAADGEIRTDLFSADVCSTLLPGTYTWAVRGDALTFVAVDEPCAGRLAFFTAGTWEHATR
jgi:hypothetical protein